LTPARSSVKRTEYYPWSSLAPACHKCKGFGRHYAEDSITQQKHNNRDDRDSQIKSEKRDVSS